MSRHAKTIRLIETARDILAEHHPMTLRQVYYQLVSRQVIENNRSQYHSVSKALVAARREGVIPWDWIEDRLRQPRHVSMWGGLADFADTCKMAYRRNVWENQSTYIEAWLEKDALSGILEDALSPYGVTLNVGRGYDGWSSIHNAAHRLDDDAAILYFGDFDPSGEDMVRSLRERLADGLTALPELSPDTETQRERQRAMGTCDIAPKSLPPGLPKGLPILAASKPSPVAPNRTNTASNAIAGKSASTGGVGTYRTSLHRSASHDADMSSLRPAGFEPATPGLGNRCSIH